jgi:hypothetical protein
MLEQAIVDAAALREAALKNAEQSLIEKYAPQIKEAVEAMLESDSPNTKMYQGRSVTVIYEADEDGNVTVSENGSKPFIVNESELSEATEEDLLQEEEAAAASDTTTTPPTEIQAPPAWDSRYPKDQPVTLTALIDNMPEDGEIEINLDDLELAMSGEEAQQAAQPPETAPTEPQQTAGDTDLGIDPNASIDDLMGDLEGGDIKLQELLNLLEEYDQEVLEEEVEVDMGEMKLGSFVTNKGDREYETDKQKAHDAHQDEEEEVEVDMGEMKLGSFVTNKGDREYETDKQKAHDAHQDEEEESEEEEKEDERLQEALGEINQLQQTFLILKEQNEKLESVVHKLNDKLEETLLSNAKLLYQNRTLNDASLNERQKSKIVEAIANAESPKEAKSLHETLRATVGSKQDSGPQSLNETVNRRSNLSSMLNTRQNINESKTADQSFKDKMQKLAGIK